MVKIVLHNDDGTTKTFVPESITPPPPPPPDPDPTPTVKSNWGVNPAYVDYYGTERPFNDLSMQMSRWQPTVLKWADSPMPPLGLDGFPLSVPAGGYLGSIIDLCPGDLNTQYEYTPGPPALRFDGSTSSSSLTIGYVNKTQPTQRLIAKVNAPILNWSLYETNNAKKGYLFRDAFLDRCRMFGMLRFMDWGRTNLDREVSWATRTPPTWYTQADSTREVAFDLMVRLCSIAQSGCWICVHHRASDDYIRSLAQLVKTELRASNVTPVPVIFEYSNEVWNFAFPQAHYAKARSPITGSPWEYNLKRSGEMAQIVKGVDPSFQVAFGGQAVLWSHMDFLLSRGIQIPAQVDILSIAPYFGQPLTATEKATVDGMLNGCDRSIGENANHIQQWKTRCDKWGKKIAGYEWGQHIALTEAEKLDTALVDRMIQANRHPRMYDLYRKAMKQWDDITGKATCCLFNSVSPYQKHGCWGLMEHEGQSIDVAHKMRAVIHHISQV